MEGRTELNIKIHNKRAFLQAIIDGRIPIGGIDVDLDYLKRHGETQEWNEHTDIPGLMITEVFKPIVRGK